MKLKLGMFLIAALLFAAPITKAFAWTSGANCASGSFDMLTWMAPAKTFNDVENQTYLTTSGLWIVPDYLQTNSGQIFDIKHTTGDLWDIPYFDANYVYQYITGSSSSYFYLPAATSSAVMFPRCVPNLNRSDKWDETINQAFPTGTYATCTGVGHCTYTYPNGYYDSAQVWGPYNYQLGAGTSAPTLVYANLLLCDSSYNNCQSKELFYFQQQWGWVYWQQFSLVNGQYVLQQSTDYTYPIPVTGYNYIGPDGNY